VVSGNDCEAEARKSRYGFRSGSDRRIVRRRRKRGEPQSQIVPERSEPLVEGRKSTEVDTSSAGVSGKVERSLCRCGAKEGGAAMQEAMRERVVGGPRRPRSERGGSLPGSNQ